MRLTDVVAALRDQWKTHAPCELHLQLAPENAQIPYAVVRFGTIEGGDGTTGENEFSVPVAIYVMTATDRQCLETIDKVHAMFDRARMAGIWYSRFNTAAFDLNYTEAASLWSAELNFTIRWTKEI